MEVVKERDALKQQVNEVSDISYPSISLHFYSTYSRPSRMLAMINYIRHPKCGHAAGVLCCCQLNAHCWNKVIRQRCAIFQASYRFKHCHTDQKFPI